MVKREKIYDSASPYRDLEGAQRYLCLGRVGVKELAKASKSIIKVGNRNIYDCQRMMKWAEEHPDWTTEHSRRYGKSRKNGGLT